MQRLLLYKTFIIFCLFIQSVLHAQECSFTNTTFKPGEELTYVVSYNWFIIWTEVGEIEMDINEVLFQGKKAYHLVGTGKTLKSWDRFFKVRDKYQVFINPKTLKPLFFKQDIQEGSNNQTTSYDFNHGHRKVVCQQRMKDNPKRIDTIPVTNCTFDILSAYLSARNTDFSKYRPGDTIPLSIIIDQQVYPIYFRYLGKENYKIKGAGEFKCLKFSVLLIEGAVFHAGEDMIIWASDDENHIPLYIESPILIGNIKVRILGIKGIRHPLTSRIR